jgi:hypothetical protein
LLISHGNFHEVVTVPQAGYAGYKNGRLLEAIENRFDVFVTIDGNLEYQQNLIGFSIGIVVVEADSNRLQSLVPKIPSMLKEIAIVKPGEIRKAT